MKTTKQIQKTWKSTTVLALIVFGLNAFSSMANSPRTMKGDLKLMHNSIENECPSNLEVVLAFANSSNAYNSSDSKISALQFSVSLNDEKSLEIESWMININNFGPAQVDDELVTDQPLEVEEWMINNNNFSALTDSKETEQPLKMENWMTEEHVWNN